MFGSLKRNRLCKAILIFWGTGWNPLKHTTSLNSFLTLVFLLQIYGALTQHGTHLCHNEQSGPGSDCLSPAVGIPLSAVWSPLPLVSQWRVLWRKGCNTMKMTHQT